MHWNYKIRFYHLSSFKSLLRIHCIFAANWQQSNKFRALFFVPRKFLHFRYYISITRMIKDSLVNFEYIANPCLIFRMKTFVNVISRNSCNTNIPKIKFLPGFNYFNFYWNFCPRNFALTICRNNNTGIWLYHFVNIFKIAMIKMTVCYENHIRFLVITGSTYLKRVYVNYFILRSFNPETSMSKPLNFGTTYFHLSKNQSLFLKIFVILRRI